MTRRFGLVLFGLVLLSASGLAAATGGEDPAVPDLWTRRAGVDWPGFLGPAGDGSSPETGLVAPWPKDGLKVVWHVPAGSGYGAPSVSKGRLFFFDRQEDKAVLTCRRAETGEELWRFAYPSDYEDYYGYDNGPRCCPVVDDDRVYTFGAEGALHCLRVADGRVLWKVDTKAEFGVVQNFFGVGSTPVVEGDLLITQVGGSPPGSGNFPSPDQKGNGSGIVAFDKRTGRVRYRLTDELASYASPVVRTVGGRRWGFVLARGGLVGFDPATGALDFHFPWRAKSLESVNASNPVVVGDRVLISEAYGPGSALLRVRPGGCDVVWSDADRGRAKSLQAHWTTPVHHDGYVYGDSGRHSGSADLRCVELATGRVRWREPGLGHCSLLQADGHLVVLAEEGLLALVRLNPQKFELVSVIEPRAAGQAGREAALLAYPCWAAPVLSHGLLYVRGKDRLVCLELIPPKAR